MTDKSDLAEKVIRFEEAKKQSEKLTFPYQVITGAARKAVEIYSRYIESPEQFIYMTFITLLGAVLARMVTLDTAVTVQTRLYTLLIGASGRSRKSTIIDRMIGFFKDVLSSDFELDFCMGVGSDAGLARRMKKARSMVLALDEFKSLTSKSSIKNSALLPTIATLFDRNEFENIVKSAKESFKIEDGFLTMIAASTPETYEEIWTPAFTNIGLNNRLFLVIGTGKKAPLPKDIEYQELKPLRIEIAKILGVIKGGAKLVFDEDARDRYNHWYMNELENSIHSQRLETYCLRLACILAVNDLKVVLDTDVIQKAITLCNWQLNIRKLHDPVDADNITAQLELKIMRNLKTRGTMSDRELIQFTNATRAGLYFFRNALNNLKNAKYVIYDRKTKTYFANV